MLGLVSVVSRSTQTTAAVVLLAEELLEANLDTIELARSAGPETDWAEHLDYLQALHREGLALLARGGGVPGHVVVTAPGWHPKST